jgi:hypothetical protein
LHCSSVELRFVIAFHQSGYRTLKDDLLRSIMGQWRGAFPHLVSDNRFVERRQEALVPLCAYLQTCKRDSRQRLQSMEPMG